MRACGLGMSETRNLSLANSVAEFGGLEKWNSQPQLKALNAMMDAMCTATTKEEALEEAHITFATALEGYADENDRGIGARFCRYADKVKDSQDGLDGGKLYAEQKALMHMTVTNREIM